MLEIGSVLVEDWKVALSTQDKWFELNLWVGCSHLGEVTSMLSAITSLISYTDSDKASAPMSSIFKLDHFFMTYNSEKLHLYSINRLKLK